MAPPARVQLDPAHLRPQTSSTSGASGVRGAPRDANNNAAADTGILFEDESHVRVYQAIAATWFLRGRQKQVPTYGHHASGALVGAVDIRGGTTMVEPAADLTAHTLQALLTRWFAQCPTQPLVVICDHAKIHHAKGLAPCWAQYGDRGEVWYLPPYSPRLNPTERLWNWLKQTVICHAFHPDVAAIATSVEKFLAHVTTVPEEVRSRLCA